MTHQTFMLKTALIAGLAAMPITAYAHGKSSDDHIDKTFDFEDFDIISVSGVYDLDVRVGADYSIEVSGHDSEMEALDIYVDGDELVLGRKKGKSKYKNNKGIIANITLPDLSGISISGVGEGDVSGIDADEFELKISGVGELTMSGNCNSLEAKISGVGEINAKELECEDAYARLSGVGELDIYASESVDIKTSGVGEANVWGSPKKVSKSKGFMSSVTIR